MTDQKKKKKDVNAKASELRQLLINCLNSFQRSFKNIFDLGKIHVSVDAKGAEIGKHNISNSFIRTKFKNFSSNLKILGCVSVYSC